MVRRTVPLYGRSKAEAAGFRAVALFEINDLRIFDVQGPLIGDGSANHPYPRLASREFATIPLPNHDSENYFENCSSLGRTTRDVMILRFR